LKKTKNKTRVKSQYVDQIIKVSSSYIMIVVPGVRKSAPSLWECVFLRAGLQCVNPVKTSYSTAVHPFFGEGVNRQSRTKLTSSR